MKRHPWLHLRDNGVWYLRAAVPAALVPKFKRKQIWVSLATKDLSVANARIRIQAAKVQGMFDECTTPPAEKHKNEELALRTSGSLIAQHLLAQQKDPEADRKLLERIEHCAESMEFIANRFFYKFSQAEPIQLNGETIKPGTMEWFEIGHLAAEEIIKEVETLKSKAEISLPTNMEISLRSPLPDHKRSEAHPPVTSLRALINSFKSEYEMTWAPKSALQYNVLFNWFEEFFGDSRDIKTITREDCRRLRDLLLCTPKNRTKNPLFRGLSIEEACVLNKAAGGETVQLKTAATYINYLSTLFKYAVGEGLLDRNPGASLLSGKRAGRHLQQRGNALNLPTTRRSFSVPELNRLFDSTIYQATPRFAALRWVPLICLFNGFRMNEVLQLEPTDVFYQDNVLCIRITTEHTGNRAESEKEGLKKRLKTSTTERIVPVHPELVRAGFTKIWEYRKRHNAVRIFGDIPAGRHGYYSDIFTKHFSRFMNRVGLPDKALVFHSLRHNFRDAARAARVPQDITFQLGGWKESGVGNTYGEGYSIPDLLNELRKIQYVGLKLPIVTFD